MSKKSLTAKSGWILRLDDLSGTYIKVFGVVKNHDFWLYTNEARDEDPILSLPLTDAGLNIPDPLKVSKRFAVEVVPCRPSAAATVAGAGSASPGQLIFCTDSKDEQESWLQALSTAAVSDDWPGGTDFGKRPQPLLYSLWLISAGNGIQGTKSPIPRLPALKAVPSWQRKALLLRKLRVGSVIFEGLDAAKYIDDREIKRNTLLEIVDAIETSARQYYSDQRVLDDTFTMVKMNLFRLLPRAPPPSGDPDEEEEVFADPQWPHLSIVYEILLRLVSTEHIDLSLKKKAIDAALVRQLLALFDSEDMRERDYLKTITHRIYSKITLRRSLIRRVICMVFLEYIYETENHNGIAQMLEILASIVSGFAVPLKDEHKVMLVKALIPLHKAKNIITYHPHLCYCMALYAAKDHALTQDIILGLLKFWPFGNSQKQIQFLNELEDIFEYVEDSDATAFREQLAMRLAKCIGGLHFQVAERALLLWNSEKFSSIMLDSDQHRPVVLSILFPPLYTNQENHWHENIRIYSQDLLERYHTADPALFDSFKAQMEAAEQAPVATSPATPPASQAPSTPLGKSGESNVHGAGATPGDRISISTASPASIQRGGSLPGTPTGSHAHRAPAVRSSMGFSSMPDADLLPGSHPKPRSREVVLPSLLPSDMADSRDE